MALSLVPDDANVPGIIESFIIYKIFFSCSGRLFVGQLT